ELPAVKVSDSICKYRMTAIYTNLDLYGTFTGKIKITGDYTKGLENGSVNWNNIFISNSNNFSQPFPPGTRQAYMENFRYIPSPKMLDAGSFKNFPATADAVFARNLVWDMMAIESFARDFTDSLKLNKSYRIPQTGGAFNMADIGSYAHNEIQVCWTGISAINNELCAVIEYRAIDNKVELSMDGFKSKGTEQYWGTTWVSLKTKTVEAAEMYSGTMQELDIRGMQNKMLVKTIRNIQVEKIY
ncbi:MAG: hypothetical protein Q8941_24870, partial [Bacteroidota bacterium]|nr:hypothetical protein [Bacteroidota bacterium]